LGPVAAESTTAADVELGNVQHDVSLPWSDPRRVSWPQIAIATDAAMFGGAVILMGIVSSARVASMSLWWAVVLGLLALAAVYRKGLYRPPLQLRVIDTTVALVTASAAAAAVTISLRVLLTGSATMAAETLRLALLASAFLIAGRTALVVHERRSRRAGRSGSPTLIVGAGHVGRLLAKRLDENRDFGLRPVGFLDKDPLELGTNGSAPSVLGASWDFDRIVQEHRIEHVVFAFSTAPTEVFLRLLKRCEALGVRTSLVPRLYEKATTEASVECLGGLPLVTRHARDPRGWQFAIKYALDRFTAALMLALVAPLFAALAIAVWISLGPPIFYRQERVGRDGKRFAMLKFRSMLPAAESEDDSLALAEDTAPGGVEGTDRRTRVGAFMRQFSLDELPQLVNVAKGEMSFVGPRPERPEFVDVFEVTVHRYGDRHRVKSGITGWAQVHGLRGKTSIADRVEWDNYYIENWSLWLDFKIMLLTFVAVFRSGEVE
jgi:exopolysaccharide biosynthesis polyprenyl glycosylphosphotransferase